VLSLVAHIASHRRRKTLKGFMIYLDNAPAHNSRRSQTCIEATRDELLSAIITIVSEIEKETLMTVFMSWTKRVRWVIRHQGEYYHTSRIDNAFLLEIGRETGRSQTYESRYVVVHLFGSAIDR
jgi:hypothetical protein